MDYVYLIEYDNGYEYEDNHNYTMAVFDDYEKAVKFCLDQDYSRSSDNYFECKEHLLGNKKESLSIEKVKLNIKIDWWVD